MMLKVVKSDLFNAEERLIEFSSVATI